MWWVLPGCSRSTGGHDGDGEVSRSPNSQAKESSPQPQIPLTSANSRVITVVPGDVTNNFISHLMFLGGEKESYRRMAISLIENHPAAVEALRRVKNQDTFAVITNVDYRGIFGELSKVQGFVLDQDRGKIVSFQKFTIAIVSGLIGEEFVNVYLIWIPNSGWMYLEQRRVPPPLRTN
jgi:hypothetical protein